MRSSMIFSIINRTAKKQNYEVGIINAIKCHGQSDLWHGGVKNNKKKKNYNTEAIKDCSLEGSSIFLGSKYQ